MAASAAFFDRSLCGIAANNFWVSTLPDMCLNKLPIHESGAEGSLVACRAFHMDCFSKLFANSELYESFPEPMGNSELYCFTNLILRIRKIYPRATSCTKVKWFLQNSLATPSGSNLTSPTRKAPMTNHQWNPGLSHGVAGWVMERMPGIHHWFIEGRWQQAWADDNSDDDSALPLQATLTLSLRTTYLRVKVLNKCRCLL